MNLKNGSPSEKSENPQGRERREKALDMAFNQINRQFGKGSIMRLGEGPGVEAIPAISTGSVSLDAALGCGGVPRGRIVEIFGPESSGKTTIALQIIAEVQRGGGMAAFVDAEHALDPTYAKALGVQTDNLIVSQPDTGEQALEIAEILTSSGSLDVVVIDSVAALVPKAELEGDMGDHHVGLQARLMSQALRKLTGVVHRSNTCFIFINQIRMKIGVMFGNPETTSGGNALKFYSSVRLDIRRIAAIKEGENNVAGARGEEQARSPVPHGGIRYHVRARRLKRRRRTRFGRRKRHRRQDGSMVFLRRGAHRPGAREREAFLERERGYFLGNRRSGARRRGNRRAESGCRRKSGAPGAGGDAEIRD